MKHIKLYKIVIISILALFLLAVACASCIAYKFYKYADYTIKIGENLPDTFRVELPLWIDSISGYFCIHGTINHQEGMNFLIDNKANSVVVQEDIQRLGALYWGKVPFSGGNAYGQNHQSNYYMFDNFTIASINFGQPLFCNISQGDYIYNTLKEEHKNLLGSNILEQLFWKFDVDEKKLVLCSKKDTTFIAQETNGYTRIENALNVFEKVSLQFLQTNTSEKFIFDLGYSGEVEINKKQFQQLAKNLPYKLISKLSPVAKKQDMVAVFDDVTIQWVNIQIPHCQVIYNSGVNLNCIGAALMHRFNFILAYGDRIKHTPQQHLYIQPVKNFQTLKSKPYISDFGFNFENKEGRPIISGIEIGGVAEIAGLKLEDKLLHVDNGAFNLNRENAKNELTTYLSNKENVEVQIEREGQIINFLLTRSINLGN
ncbi:hypothetical protein FACS1894162_0260 [Bacteroidia bacterium]|nr:hypothetical protein FACS1894162_0260 [Bacteroidia bacterium]